MNSYLEVLSKSIQFGEETLKKIERKNGLEIEHKIILSLYRKLLEQVDGIYILADHKLEGPGRILIRSAMETVLALKYILQEKKWIQDRAFSYYVCFLKSELQIAKDSLELNFNDEPINKKELELNIKESELILNQGRFNKVLNEWERTNKKSKYEPKWHSLFNGPTSIKKLVDKVADDEISLLYGLLSMEAHGYHSLSASNNKDLTKDDFALKPLRNGISDEMVKYTRTLLTGITMKMIKLIAPECNPDLIIFAKEIGIIPKNYPFSIPKI
ncbi:hypothetical protein DN390_23940 [Bacillus sp. SH7-1]|uniref:DUF5677 domain-containing protein n=1 Tax=Bacillus sp. SH7-1 TaxID=2217818 RepID=UPI0011C83BC4|nr:DUF5677 domain-containing protein [Bacillus sp. SH7-1]TXR94740.1 hypothetical protein DN390_23940 [Bacillus sp. SH7-1]